MAMRGRQLPWRLRQAIAERIIAGETLRTIAQAEGVSKTTACKYKKLSASLVQNQHKAFQI